MALPLVHAARHNDVKPLLGRELMILTHDDDDDDVCMYVCMYVCYSLRPKARGRDGHPFVVPWGLSGSPGREKKGPHPSAPPELVTMN